LAIEAVASSATSQADATGAGSVLITATGASFDAASSFAGAGTTLLQPAVAALTGDAGFAGAGAADLASGALTLASAGDFAGVGGFDYLVINVPALSGTSDVTGMGVSVFDGAGAFAAASDSSGAGTLLLQP